MKPPGVHPSLRNIGFRGLFLFTGKLVVMSDEVAEIDQDRIDRIIWENAGRIPARKIAELVGWTPEAVLRRKSELLDFVDELTIQEKRHRIMVDLEGIASEARTRAKTAADEFYSGMLNSSIAAMKTVLVELNRLENKSEDAVNRLNQQRVKELLRLIDTTVDATLTKVAQKHGLDKADLMDIFQEELLESAKEFDK